MTSYLRQLRTLAAAHSLQVHRYRWVTVSGTLYGRPYHCTSPNAQLALAALHTATASWPAVCLYTMDGHIRSRCLTRVLHNYTGLVRVYHQGRVPSTWVANEGKLYERLL